MLERKEPFIKKPMMDNYDILRMRETSEMMIKSARCDRVPPLTSRRQEMFDELSERK